MQPFATGWRPGLEAPAPLAPVGPVLHRQRGGFIHTPGVPCLRHGGAAASRLEGAPFPRTSHRCLRSTRKEDNVAPGHPGLTAMGAASTKDQAVDPRPRQATVAKTLHSPSPLITRCSDQKDVIPSNGVWRLFNLTGEICEGLPSTVVPADLRMNARARTPRMPMRRRPPQQMPPHQSGPASPDAFTSTTSACSGAWSPSWR